MNQTAAARFGPRSRCRRAIQLQALRDIDTSLPETIRRVADAGFEGVEFGEAFLESNPHAVRESLNDTGVTPVAAHVDLTWAEANVEALADRMRHVGCRRAIVPHLGGGHFRTKADVDAIASRLEALAGSLDSYGIQLSYHVSREPFLPLLDRFGLATPVKLPSTGIIWRLVAEAADLTIRESSRTLDVTAFHRLVTRTDELTFEVDVGWVAAGGYDPVDVFDYLGDRMPLIHIADVRRTDQFLPTYRSVPPGDGILDLDRVLEAARQSDVDWLVYEAENAESPQKVIEHGRSLFMA